MTEQVAVVQLRVPAEHPHRAPHLRLHERVDDDRRTPFHAVDRKLQVGDALHPRVPDLEELLFRELRLQCQDEPLRGLARGIGDHVQLDRDHARELNVGLMRLLGFPGIVCR